MGNMCGGRSKGSKASKPSSSKDASGAKTYSWDQRTGDASEFMVQGETGKVIVKAPGSINGNQFVIEECTDCTILVLDHSENVMIDDCTNCRIFIGPCSSSVFLRTSQNTSLVVACQQFRTRQVEQCNISLYSLTRPIIESSKAVRFGCFQFAYPQLAEQFVAANLQPLTNPWAIIHDFTPMPGNWSYLPEDTLSVDLLGGRDVIASALAPHSVTLASGSVVPLTHGMRGSLGGDKAFLLCVGSTLGADLLEFIATQDRPPGSLVQCKDVKLTPQQAQAVLGQSNNAHVIGYASRGALVAGMEWSGDDVISMLRQVVDAFAKARGDVNIKESIHISTDLTVAAGELDAFFEQVTVEI